MRALELHGDGFGFHNILTGWEAYGWDGVGSGGAGIGRDMVFERSSYVGIFDPSCLVIEFLVVERETCFPGVQGPADGTTFGWEVEESDFGHLDA